MPMGRGEPMKESVQRFIELSAELWVDLPGVSSYIGAIDRCG